MTVVATLSLTDAASNISAFIIQLIFKPLVTEPPIWFQYNETILKYNNNKNSAHLLIKYKSMFDTNSLK